MVALLEVRDVVRRYRHGGRTTAAVDGVSLTLAAGQCTGLVGESGSGKSTLARIVAGLEQPDAGHLLWRGRAMPRARPKALRQEIGLIFQDPTESLDPRWVVDDLIAEPMRLAGHATRVCRARVTELLDEVGLPGAVRRRRPHELSGGQRQRVAIARALATRPALLVADEPLAALDVSVAAQVANLLMDLAQRHRLACLFISHDLAMVAHIADKIAVMYHGRIVEEGASASLVGAPQHPYTRALLASRPRLPGPDCSLAPETSTGHSH